MTKMSKNDLQNVIKNANETIKRPENQTELMIPKP